MTSILLIHQQLISIYEAILHGSEIIQAAIYIQLIYRFVINKIKVRWPSNKILMQDLKCLQKKFTY